MGSESRGCGEFADPADHDALAPGDRLRLAGIPAGLATGALEVEHEPSGRRIPVRCALTERERAILLAGGRLAHTRAHAPATAA